MSNTALVRRREAAYPAPPFDPPCIYPELRRLGLTATDPNNTVYPMVRRCLELLDLDRAGRGSAQWNPLGDLVGPDSRVVVKPNFVQHENYGGGGLDHLVTHPAVLRPLLDYLWLARGGLEGVHVVDAPEINCRFDLVLERLGWAALTELYAAAGQRLDVLDIRPEWADYRHGAAIVERHRLPGDPRGFVDIDLGTASALVPIAGRASFYGADYDRRHTNEAHTASVNRYRVSRTFLEADLVVSVPKLKTHKKAGITCSLKNLVGINGDKNLLPHYTIGDTLVGGCEYSTAPRSWIVQLHRKLDRIYRDRLLATRSRLAGQLYNRFEPLRDRFLGRLDADGQMKGDWWGNDVVWRMILDLYRILRCAAPGGELAGEPLRRQLAIVDAVVVGEGEGPHLATPHRLGAVIAGLDAVAVDTLGAALLGFDPRQIPQLVEGARCFSPSARIGGAATVTLDTEAGTSVRALESFLGSAPTVMPPAGWLGHVEWSDAAPALQRT
ncbi:MAG TPA: DUF362 domain-containing protein [Candidatus Polarisedimenticolaceae bacterium]|nr:DUF362 domain-containing protein [Candidatus Polarisedimenticolaceae bacterium]